MCDLRQPPDGEYVESFVASGTGGSMDEKCKCRVVYNSVTKPLSQNNDGSFNMATIPTNPFVEICAYHRRCERLAALAKRLADCINSHVGGHETTCVCVDCLLLAEFKETE